MNLSTKEKEEVCKSGLMAASMKDFGKTIRQTAEEGSFMQTAMFIQDSGSKTKRRVWECINILTDRFMMECG